MVAGRWVWVLWECLHVYRGLKWRCVSSKYNMRRDMMRPHPCCNTRWTARRLRQQQQYYYEICIRGAAAPGINTSELLYLRSDLFTMLVFGSRLEIVILVAARIENVEGSIARIFGPPIFCSARSPPVVRTRPGNCSDRALRCSGILIEDLVFQLL